METATQHDKPGGIWLPALCGLLGLFCLLFPEFILIDYDRLPKRAFGVALAMIWFGMAMGLHAWCYWHPRGYATVSVIGRTLGALLALAGFAWVFAIIIRIDGWPW